MMMVMNDKCERSGQEDMQICILLSIFSVSERDNPLFSCFFFFFVVVVVGCTGYCGWTLNSSGSAEDMYVSTISFFLSFFKYIHNYIFLCVP